SVRTDEPRVPVLRSTGLPAALIGRPGDPRGVPWCDVDFEEAGGLAVRELVKAGHRTIAFLAATDGEFRAGMNYAPRCLAGVRAAAREAGIRLVVRRPGLGGQEHADAASAQPLVRRAVADRARHAPPDLHADGALAAGGIRGTARRF